MLLKSKIKWFALVGVFLSSFSVLVHFLLAKYSTSSQDLILVQSFYPTTSLLPTPPHTTTTNSARYARLWGAVKMLSALQPFANPRSGYPPPVPKDQSNGFIYVKIYGGFERIRNSICDVVVVARLLNATLVIPELQESTRAKGISYKFKSFSYLYNEDQFIAGLVNDISVVKNLPNDLQEGRKKKRFPIFSPKHFTSPDYYVQEVLPKLKKFKVVGLIIADGGCLQSILPPTMVEYQRLRCRVSFHALQFRLEIQNLGHQIVQRLRAWSQPFLAFHPGLVRDTLAFHGCAELFQDVHAELIQYRRAQLIKQGVIHEELLVDSQLRRINGSCPIMPEEVGLLLRAMGYSPETVIYVAGAETFGGPRVLIPLRALYTNLVDRTSLCSKKELASLIGPEAPLPSDTQLFSPAKSEKQIIEDWNKAGPRPRPLPPPPGRPIYWHEKEGWYGWVTETDIEPDPPPSDLRLKAHRLLWDAIDYIVSVEADAFFPGFDNDRSGFPDFASLVMGHRLYQMAAGRTYRPDRKVLIDLLDSIRDHMYFPNRNWTAAVRDHLGRSLGKDGIIKKFGLSKPLSFLSHPSSLSFLSHPSPECSCKNPGSAEHLNAVKVSSGETVIGSEDECPAWMQSSLEKASFKATFVEDDGIEDNELLESNENMHEADASQGGESEEDDEMDPDD